MEKISIQFDPYGILLDAAIKQTEEILGRPLLKKEMDSVKQTVKSLLNPAFNIEYSVDQTNNKFDNSCDQSFDLSDFAQQAMDMFWSNVNKCKSVGELEEFLRQVDSRINQSKREIKQMELEDRIDRLAHDIRMVVVCFVTIKHEPYPYIFKRNYPLLKNAHHRVIAARNTSLFLKSVRFAQKDMFQGEYKIYEYPKDMRKYFEVYTDNPLLFNIRSLIEFIPHKYKESLQDFIL